MLMMGLIFACQPKQKDAAKGKTEKSGKITLAFNQEFTGNLNPHEYLPSQFITQDMVYDGLFLMGKMEKLSQCWQNFGIFPKMEKLIFLN